MMEAASKYYENRSVLDSHISLILSTCVSWNRRFCKEVWLKPYPKGKRLISNLPVQILCSIPDILVWRTCRGVSQRTPGDMPSAWRCGSIRLTLETWYRSDNRTVRCESRLESKNATMNLADVTSDVTSEWPKSRGFSPPTNIFRLLKLCNVQPQRARDKSISH